MAEDERFPLVDETGAIVGSARRGDCHGNPDLLHPVVHCLVTNAAGEMLLQRRSRDKDIQPGKWDTAVGGHVSLGERVEDALAREMAEEIGLDATTARPRPLYRYIWRTAVESELVYTYACVAEGPFSPDPGEIEALRFWTRAAIEDALGTGALTPNCEEEYARFSAMREGDARA